MIPVDEAETKKFVEWLPDIKWNEAFVVMLLIRSKKLKERYGFKGTDHVLKLEIVPGYVPLWRRRLLSKIKRFAILAYYSEEVYEYVRYKPGTREPDEVIPIPRELVGVMMSVNPADWVRASVKAVDEFSVSLVDAMYNPGEAPRIVRRVDLRVPALCMRYAKRKFHMIDLDTKHPGIVEDFESRLREVLGHVPARVETPHGYHYLVRVSAFDRDAAKKWFGDFLKNLPNIRRTYADTLGVAGEEAEKLIEYKKDFQEPVPGTRYQGDFIVRFRPEQ